VRTSEEVICKEAQFMLENRATVRQASQHFGRSKSTIHIDMRVRLPYVNKALAVEVAKLLEFNTQERTMRGGIATKEKYAKMRRN
jgi:putative DeoR family transcriptional regulator (stage III sporulation protein D)